MAAGADQPAADSELHAMVLNVGRRPTVEADASAAITVEAHIMHGFAADFYGKHCKALVSGFIRSACRPSCCLTATVNSNPSGSSYLLCACALTPLVTKCDDLLLAASKPLICRADVQA